ncbi:MAG: ATP-grasp domain-containing protein [Candidatus Sericytochromatia bacterium]|nr:ATP-grasp domain-containing protein [Candidatus Sericytochromatia bacterium]
MMWFLQGQSSQRDVILAAKAALGGQVSVLASHRQHRPEITDHADISLREPEDAEDRVTWVLAEAAARGVRIVHAGRATRAYEAARARFEAAGLTLVTGALSLDTFDQVDDKAAFTRIVAAAGLPVVSATEVQSAAELREALAARSQEGPVCVKPTRGIYGQGFWKIGPEADPFACLANADDRLVAQSLFEQAYEAAASPKPLLVMRYFPGPERSVDMVCEAGTVVGAVGRRKENGVQTLERGGAAMELAAAAARLFRCDGIINVQTRDDELGDPHLLEINLRPSGGIGYTLLGGVNLPGIFATRRLGLPAPADRWQGPVTIRSITSAVVVTPDPGV